MIDKNTDVQRNSLRKKFFFARTFLIFIFILIFRHIFWGSSFGIWLQIRFWSWLWDLFWLEILFLGHRFGDFGGFIFIFLSNFVLDCIRRVILNLFLWLGFSPPTVCVFHKLWPLLRLHSLLFGVFFDSFYRSIAVSNKIILLDFFLVFLCYLL